jgi:hypothetical protein
VDLAKLDLHKVDLAKLELPAFELPKFDVPKFDVPNFDLPKLDLDDVAARLHVADVTAFADEARSRATTAATSVKGNVNHAVTLLREAVGV